MHPQEVDQQVASNYAEEIGAIFLETSAKDDTNVQDIFTRLSALLPAAVAPEGNVIRPSLSNGAPPQGKPRSGGCC